jgi:hypothetical protein
MSVISITITESSDQIVSGIPRSVTISTNIISTIFYTLDGCDPTILSDIYVGALFLPTTQHVILKIFATNGVDSSPIITEEYSSDILQNLRLPHSATDVQAGENIPPSYPFGTPPSQPMGIYLNPGDASVTVNNPELYQYSDGYDADGYPAIFSNLPYNLQNYSILYSDSNAEGVQGRGIGNLPATVIVEQPPPIAEQTNQFSNTFDPRSFVIFQDFTQQNLNDPPVVNRQFWCLEDSEKIRQGNNYFNTGLDSPTITGTFIRREYNDKDNTMTYYYFDSLACRWIISKSKFEGDLKKLHLNLSGVKPGRGSSKVFEWLPFTRRVLF